jgi:hypothetical protein
LKIRIKIQKFLFPDYSSQNPNISITNEASSKVLDFQSNNERKNDTENHSFASIILKPSKTSNLELNITIGAKNFLNNLFPKQISDSLAKPTHTNNNYFCQVR